MINPNLCEILCLPTILWVPNVHSEDDVTFYVFIYLCMCTYRYLHVLMSTKRGYQIHLELELQVVVSSLTWSFQQGHHVLLNFKRLQRLLHPFISGVIPMFLSSISVLNHYWSVCLPGVTKGKPSPSHSQHRNSIDSQLWCPDSCGTGPDTVYFSTIYLKSFPYSDVYTFYVFMSLLLCLLVSKLQSSAVQNEEILHKWDLWA